MNEEIGFNLSTNSDIAESGCAIVVESDDWGLSVGVSEEDTKVVVLSLSALNHDEWVHTIGALATQAIVIGAHLARGPHGPSAFTNVELVHTFTQTVDILWGESEIHLDVLVHED